MTDRILGPKIECYEVAQEQSSSIQIINSNQLKERSDAVVFTGVSPRILFKLLKIQQLKSSDVIYPVFLDF